MKRYYYSVVAILVMIAGVLGIFFYLNRIKQIVIYDGSRLEISGTMYYVSPNGDDSQDGRTEKTAMLSIQKAIALLMPGDGLTLLDGEYQQDFITMQDGTAEKKIAIMGSRKAIVKGTGKKGRIVEIGHDNIILSGFTVDGLAGDGRDKKNYRDKLIYVEGLEEKQGVTGMRIMYMQLKNAGGECLRIKYFSQKNEIDHNNINNCGVYDFVFEGGGKNGEGIYIGTAPEQIKKDKNITRDIDQSDHNWVHDNIIDTRGNECVDVKEGSSFNVIEKNICTGQQDKESAGLDSRGNDNIFRYNEVFGCVGAGIRLGGDSDVDGINNEVRENKLHDNGAGGIKIQNKPQGKICGNKITGNGKGDLVGEYGSDMKNDSKCN
ncbi:MAG: right-handed parallel beta-helix repeat-containing protein [Parcubacteria group bacterium]